MKRVTVDQNLKTAYKWLTVVRGAKLTPLQWRTAIELFEGEARQHPKSLVTQIKWYFRRTGRFYSNDAAVIVLAAIISWVRKHIK